jgi:hypothetical protein
MRAPILSLVATVWLLHSAPAFAQGAATICKDGSTSAASGRGACADHGGVDKSATKQATRAVKSEQKAEIHSAKAAGTPVACADGSTSNPGRGACSHHGGVRIAGSAAGTIAPLAPAREARLARENSTPLSASATTVAPSRRGEDNDPTGAIAQCRDGLYSHAANHRGACARHKGVAKWMP